MNKDKELKHFEEAYLGVSKQFYSLQERYNHDIQEQMTALSKVKDKQITDLKAEKDKLQAFKDYVHKRLDDAGIPVDPESPHKEAGCRIGGRLDVVLSEIERLKGENDILEKTLSGSLKLAEAQAKQLIK